MSTGPAVAFEELAWPSYASAHTLGLSRSAFALIRPTYMAAVPPFIAGMTFDVAPAVLAEAEDARAEITRFDAELSSRFGEVEVAPLAAVLLRTESASSSQIERITVSARALAMAEVGVVKHGSNAALVTANVAAMQRALEASTAEIDVDALLAIHDLLMAGQDDAEPGHFRTSQNWIGVRSISPHGAEFVPPHQSRVPELVDDLCQFLGRTDVPLLVHAAIAHAQFETIHPFSDGNGRVGRALVHTLLRQGRATTRTTVPVSAGLLADTSGYEAALTAYRSGDVEPIVRSFSDAAFRAVANGRTLSNDLHSAYERWQDVVTARSDAAVWRVLPHLLSHPAVTSASIRKLTGVSQPVADTAIRTLVEAGVLTKMSSGSRNRVWVAREVTTALDAFGERAKRRLGVG